MASTTATVADVLATPDRERRSHVARGGPVELTVAFTDLEDFTAYTESSGDEAARRLLVEHHRDAGPIVRGRGGRILKRLGDGLMLIFPTPEAAVLACLELGRIAPLPMRAGIHCGQVLVTDDDVVGHAVNLAARVTGSARSTQVMVTERVRSAVDDVQEVSFGSPIARSFKGVAEQVTMYVARLER